MSEKVVGLIRSGGVILLFVIGAILILGAMDTQVDEDTGEAVGDVSAVLNSVNYAMWLVRLSVLAIAIFTVIAIIKNPKKFIPSGIGLVVFGIVAFIGYSMASSEMIEGIAEHPDATEGALKMGGAGIKTTFLLVIIASALIIAGSVMSMMRYFSKS